MRVDDNCSFKMDDGWRMPSTHPSTHQQTFKIFKKFALSFLSRSHLGPLLLNTFLFLQNVKFEGTCFWALFRPIGQHLTIQPKHFCTIWYKSLAFLTPENMSKQRFATNRAIGREPWCSGYGRRLVSWRSWIWIPAPDIGWTFFTHICCKNCNVCLKRRKWDGPFLNK